MRQTTMLKSAEVKKDWYVVDASGKNLGRLATQCAAILRGKHKPTFTPNVDCGDYVIIVNAAKVQCLVPLEALLTPVVKPLEL
ncbi:MAG: 50S ribosomal protein L13, partial [Erysipelotrichaceae bacterium]|nr:50S ribosomal protein L13 [Erysipelotrichaceae bacterium]